LVGDNATGDADNQQGSRTRALSGLVLTLQRLNAELLERSLERLVKREEREVLESQLETRMKIQSTPYGDIGSHVNKVAVPEGAAGSPPF
jgi:hypothetical protein